MPHDDYASVNILSTQRNHELHQVFRPDKIHMVRAYLAGFKTKTNLLKT